MSPRKASSRLLLAWTPVMAAWFALYEKSDATCGPEIYLHCTVGANVATGLGRSGIVLLWLLGLLALGTTWGTTRRGRRRERDRERNAGCLLFVSTPAGYVLRERDSGPPAVGSEVEDEGQFLTVVRIGPSPLPNDPRPCAFLLVSP